MQIGVYTRKSRVSEKGESIRNQITICKEYCRGLENPEFIIYEDEGYSGGDTMRPGFHKMMNDIANGQLQAVVCYRLDRISRSVSDFSNTLQFFNQHNIAFLSVKERFDTSTPLGRAMMYISSVFAQLERETIAERLQDNLRRLSRTGRWLGGIAPFGFHSQRQQQPDQNGVMRTYCLLAPNTEEQNVVKQLFNQYIATGSLQRVLDFTQDNKIKTRKNKSYCARSLKHILSNPVYVKSNPAVYDYYASLGCEMASPPELFCGCGLHISGQYQKQHNKQTTLPCDKWTIATGFHDGFIDADIFLQTQCLLQKNKTKPSRSHTSHNALLSGLLICPKCGAPMLVNYKTPNTPNGQLHYYYRCRQKNISRGTLCDMANINGRKADALVLDALETICQNNVPHLILSLKQTLEQQNAAHNTLASQQSQLTQKIKNLSAHLADNPDTAASKFILIQIEEYANQLAELAKQEITKANESPYDTSAPMVSLHSILSPKSWPFSMQKQLVSLLIQSIHPQTNTLWLSPSPNPTI